jgi:hypothetical protein
MKESSPRQGKVARLRAGGGVIKPPRHFVAVPLGKGDKVGFTLSGVLLSEVSSTSES